MYHRSCNSGVLQILQLEALFYHQPIRQVYRSCSQADSLQVGISVFGGNMLFKSNVSRVVFSLLLVLSLSVITFADTIRLKDGSIIKGKIVTFSDGKFVIAMGEGSRRRELTFTAAEIESIQFDTPAAVPQTNSASNQPASYKEPVKSNPPIVVTSDNTGRTNDPPSKSADPSSPVKPIEWSVKVLADNTANGWTNSGWVVKKGQRISITGEGKVNLGKGQTSPPSGVASLNDDQKLLKNVATGALIAVIGDDNNDFIYVGAEREFTATRDGALFLGINEGYLDDNSGSFNVKIEILPDGDK